MMKPNRPKPRDPDKDLPEVDLPPLAEDEEAGDIGAPLDDFIEEQRNDGMSWLDDRLGIEDYDHDAVADEIGATGGEAEPTWLEGSDADESLEGTEADLDDGDEYGWTTDSDIMNSEDWSELVDIVEYDSPSIVDDAGEEGLDDDQHEIDTSEWTKLDEEEGEGVEDEDEMGGLVAELSFEQERRIGGGLLPPRLDESQLKAAWFGPEDVMVTAVAFRDFDLCAVGAGFFVVDENRLQPRRCSPLVDELQATSVAMDPTEPNRIYVGTLLGGALITNDKGETIEPINGWADVIGGCGTPRSPSCSVKVKLGGRGEVGGEPKLWLLTDSGALVSSASRGERWDVVLPDVEVRDVAPDPQGVQVAAFGRDREGVAVFWSADGREFHRRRLPDEEVRGLWASPDPRIAIRDEAVLLGAEEYESGLIFSPSLDGDWSVLEECPRATAVALQGEKGKLNFYAGLFFAGRDLGTLVRKRQGVDDWMRICDIERLGGLFEIDQIGMEDVSTRIHEISLNPTNPRQIALATGRGIFLLEMKDLLD